MAEIQNVYILELLEVKLCIRIEDLKKKKQERGKIKIEYEWIIAEG